VTAAIPSSPSPETRYAGTHGPCRDRTRLQTIQPASPFIYSFLDEEYQKKFNTEARIGNLATVFSGLAILISCLGLFGLASL